MPFAYSTVETRPLEIQLIPPPNDGGILQLVCALTADIDTTDEDAPLLLPNEYVHAIKYYALHSILSGQNETHDAMRGQYALERYNSIIRVSESRRSVLRVQLNNRNLPLDTLYALDQARYAWQNQRGLPKFAAASFDLLALAPVPNGNYGVSCDLVASAPLPATFDDYVQLGREEIPYILDYARHLLSFKLGGDEFASSFPLYDNFQAGAARRNTRLAETTRYLTPLFGQPEKEQDVQPATN